MLWVEDVITSLLICSAKEVFILFGFCLVLLLLLVSNNIYIPLTKG